MRATESENSFVVISFFLFFSIVTKILDSSYLLEYKMKTEPKLKRFDRYVFSAVEGSEITTAKYKIFAQQFSNGSRRRHSPFEISWPSEKARLTEISLSFSKCCHR